MLRKVAIDIHQSGVIIAVYTIKYQNGYIIMN